MRFMSGFESRLLPERNFISAILSNITLEVLSTMLSPVDFSLSITSFFVATKKLFRAMAEMDSIETITTGRTTSRILCLILTT